MSASSIQIVTGPRAQTGPIGDLRGSATGAQVVTDAHGRYQEAAVRSVLFHASIGAAGAPPGTALGTAPPLSIWNPPNSGKIGVVLRARCGYVSGTLGAGTIVYAYTPQLTVPTGGTELQPVSGLLAGVSGALRAFQGSTHASVPLLVAPAFSLSAFLATTAVQPFTIGVDEPAGDICIPPGVALVLQGIAAAGTTPVVLLSASYEEVPIVIST